MRNGIVWTGTRILIITTFFFSCRSVLSFPDRGQKPGVESARISAFDFIVDRNGGGDFTTIQPAVDAALNNGGGRILVKAGVYIIDESIRIGSETSGAGHVLIQGEGERTIVKACDHCDGINIFFVGSLNKESPFIDDIQIVNLGVDGNKSSNQGDAWYEGNGILVGRVTRCVLRDISVSNCSYYGILMKECGEGSLVQSCVAENNGAESSGEAGDGIQIWDSHGVAVMKNTVTGNRWAGIQLLYSEESDVLAGNIVQDNIVSGNRCHGIVVYQSGGNIISGNTLTGLGDNDLGCGSTGPNPQDTPEIGVLIQGKKNVVGNNVIRAFERGIWITNDRDQGGANDNIIDGNLITNIEFDGIQVYRWDDSCPMTGDQDISAGTIIRGNNISNCGYNGIAVLRNPRQQISGNVVHHNGKNGIHLYRSRDSNVTGNRCYDNGVAREEGSRNGISIDGYCNSDADASNLMISSNICTNFDENGSQEHGIFCNPDKVYSSLIHGNYCLGNQGQGISVDESSNVVTDNLTDSGYCDQDENGKTDSADVSSFLSSCFY